MKKKIILPVMVGLLMVLATVGITYAFFNYTRTGSANTVRTGTINFTSSQTRINLSNIFPISSSDVSTDTDNVGTATITVTGDTSYDKGIEYLISATNVTNTIGTKNIPISITGTASGTLGTSDEDYFDNRDTATNHIYKVLAKDTISNDDQLMVGYIAKGATGINGAITIKAYIDKDKILISDTYPEGEVVIDGVTYYNGTPTTNKTVFTTSEWNSFQNTGVSFQVKVEANEGIWVVDGDRNDMKYFYSTFTGDQKSSITQIEFIKMSENEINTHSNLLDLTADGGNGMVKAWIENNKLYIASPGTTYFPSSCSGLFVGFNNVTSILFNNVNTSNVTTMNGMFSGCSSLLSINLSNMGGNSLTNASMFNGCTNLSSVNMHGFDFGTSSLGGLFAGLYNLEVVDLSNVNISNVTNTGGMFNMDTYTNKLTTIYVSSDWNVDNITVSGGMFYGCTSLKGGGTPQTTYDANHIDKEYARIDGGANSSTPGYLTLKTN